MKDTLQSITKNAPHSYWKFKGVSHRRSIFFYLTHYSFVSYHKAGWEAVPSNLVQYVKISLHYHWVPFWSPPLNRPNRSSSLHFGSERSQSTRPGFISDTNQKIRFWSAPNVLQPLIDFMVHRIILELTQRKNPCSKHSLRIGTITYFILQIQLCFVTRFMLTETKSHALTSSY